LRRAQPAGARGEVGRSSSLFHLIDKRHCRNWFREVKAGELCGRRFGQRGGRAALATPATRFGDEVCRDSRPQAASASEAPKFTEAKISEGRVVARLSDGRRPTFRKPDCQVGHGPSAEQLRISPDRRGIGWAVACQTGDETYPIAEEVVVYGTRNDRPQRFNNGLTVTSWRFVSSRRIEICTDTAHGSLKPGCRILAIGRRPQVRPPHGGR
jgi:hypothetical protein